MKPPDYEKLIPFMVRIMAVQVFLKSVIFVILVSKLGLEASLELPEAALMVPDRSQIDPKLIPDQVQIGPRSVADRSQIGPRSVPDRSQIGPRSVPNHSQISPKAVPDRSPIDCFFAFLLVLKF